MLRCLNGPHQPVRALTRAGCNGCMTALPPPLPQAGTLASPLPWRAMTAGGHTTFWHSPSGHGQASIADYVPEFANHSKGQVTLTQVLSHQGGFRDANITPEAWED